MVTELGHVAYQSMRLGRRNALGSSSVLYPYSAEVQKKKRIRPRITNDSKKRSLRVATKLHMGHLEWLNIIKSEISMLPFVLSR